MKQDKFSSLFDFLPKSKVKAGDGLEVGKYPFYTSSELQTKYLNKYQYEPGCLVFGTGGKASVHFTTSLFSTSTDCVVARPKAMVSIDAGYVFQFLKSNMQILESGFKGAGLKHISKAYLSEIAIPHPEELGDQKRIAHLLGKVEGLIAERKKHLQQLDDMLKSVFLETFGDPVKNDRGWATEPLGKLATIERGRFSPRPRNDPKFYGGIYPFIQTGDISRSNGRLREFTQTLNELGAKVSKEFKVGTIVIAIVGATIGETAVLEISTYATDSVIGISPKTGTKEIESIFLEFLLRFWKPILRARAPEAARANINIETLRPMQIIWPNLDYRKKFAEIVNKVEGIKSSYHQSLSDLEILYGALSQKAFKGELDLTRVPVPIRGSCGKFTDEGDKQIMEPTFELPAPEDIKSLQTPEGRKLLIEQWLTVWLNRPGDSPFAPQEFMDSARERLQELMESYDHDMGKILYEELKSWIFNALEQGMLLQKYNDANNCIELSKAKS